MTVAYQETLGGFDSITAADYFAGPSRTVRRLPAVLKWGRRPRQVEVIEEAKECPDWVGPTLNQMVGLFDLAENWDSYGAKPIDLSYVSSALELLWMVMQDGTPAPTVVPTKRGGVQLEWHSPTIDLEIETLSTQKYAVFFEEAGADSWEGEIASDLAPLVGFIAKLSHSD